MKVLADALVYVITALDISPRGRPEQLDDDVKMLESLGAFLHEANPSPVGGLHHRVLILNSTPLRRPLSVGFQVL